MKNRKELLKERLKDLIKSYAQYNLSFEMLDTLIDDDDPIIHDVEMVILEDLCQNVIIGFKA